MALLQSLAVALVLCGSVEVPAVDHGLPRGRLTLLDENDALAPPPSDRWYTQGMLVTYLSPRLPDAPFDRLELNFGQSMFVPAVIFYATPDPSDRPYAGWVYGSVGAFRERRLGPQRTVLDHFELTVGIVGPASQAMEVQRDFHKWLRQGWPLGWPHQLQNELGVVLTWERKWRFAFPLIGSLGIDVIPEVGGSLGNVFTYAEAGAMLRFGQNLQADYGPLRIRPSLSGTAWFDTAEMTCGLGWYMYGGVQARAIGRNIFIDGNTWQPSARTGTVPLVADITGGLALSWRDFVQLQVSLTARSPEFAAQVIASHFGGINLSFRIP